jgi:uncharacterized protein
MESTFLIAFGLMLVLEGAMPLIAPKLWRDTFKRLTNMADGQIRFLGLLSAGSGLVMLAVFR